MSMTWGGGARRHYADVNSFRWTQIVSNTLANLRISDPYTFPAEDALRRDVEAAFLEKEIEHRITADALIGAMPLRELAAWWYWTRQGAPAFVKHPLVRLIRLATSRNWISLPKPKPRQEIHQKIYRICPHIRLEEGGQRHFEWLTAGTRTCPSCGNPVPYEEGAGFCSLKQRERDRMGVHRP